MRVEREYMYAKNRRMKAQKRIRWIRKRRITGQRRARHHRRPKRFRIRPTPHEFLDGVFFRERPGP
eukprot:UN06108